MSVVAVASSEDRRILSNIRVSLTYSSTPVIRAKMHVCSVPLSTSWLTASRGQPTDYLY